MNLSKGWRLIVSLICIGILAACISATPTQDPAVALAEYDAAISRYNQITAGMTYEDDCRDHGYCGCGTNCIDPPGDRRVPARPPITTGNGLGIRSGWM